VAEFDCSALEAVRQMMPIQQNRREEMAAVGTAAGVNAMQAQVLRSWIV
jgi:hypothetical protein